MKNRITVSFDIVSEDISSEDLKASAEKYMIETLMIYYFINEDLENFKVELKESET